MGKNTTKVTAANGSKVHTNENFTAITVPASGFEKLIRFENHKTGQVWTHKNFVK